MTLAATHTPRQNSRKTLGRRGPAASRRGNTRRPRYFSATSGHVLTPHAQRMRRRPQRPVSTADRPVVISCVTMLARLCPGDGKRAASSRCRLAVRREAATPPGWRTRQGTSPTAACSGAVAASRQKTPRQADAGSISTCRDRGNTRRARAHDAAPRPRPWFDPASRLA